RESLGRIDEWLARLRQIAKSGNAQPASAADGLRRGEHPTPEAFASMQRHAQRPTPAFEEALDDDLNISAALGFLFESIRETNRAMDESKLDGASGKAALAWWKRSTQVL